MSAWPEAVYIIKQIQNALNLNQRVLKLQNRLFVFAAVKSSAVLEPDLEDEYNFSNDSIWFVQKSDDNSKIYAVSVYSETQGWSSLIYLSPNGNQIDFTPSTGTGILANVDNVEDALNILANAIGNIQISDATKNSKGIVQIGNNINVTNGTISVPNGSSSTAGAVKMYNTSGTATDGTMTQAAIKAAIGQSPLIYETAVVTGWSDTPVTLPGRNFEYYTTTVTLGTSYGEHPTISLGVTSPYDTPTIDQSKSYYMVDFAIANGNILTFYARFKPQTDFTIIVKV